MPSAINIKKLLEGVEFDPDDVVGTAVKQGVLFTDAIQYRLDCMTAQKRAELAHKRIEAETSLAVRKQYKEAGDKITEDNVKALVLLNSKVRKAADEEATADVYDEYSKLVCEVFRMRRDCLQIVTKMTADEVREQRALQAGSDKMREQRNTLREKFPGGV